MVALYGKDKKEYFREYKKLHPEICRKAVKKFQATDKSKRYQWCCKRALTLLKHNHEEEYKNLTKSLMEVKQ
jgi:hypothetical protein